MQRSFQVFHKPCGSKLLVDLEYDPKYGSLFSLYCNECRTAKFILGEIEVKEVNEV